MSSLSQRFRGPIPLLAAALSAALLASAAAQDRAPPGIDRDSIRSRPRLAWTKVERDYAFAHWEDLFATRVVRRGERIRELTAGPAWPAFAPGGAGAQQLQRSIDDFQLAGLVVLHDGRLRLERYARAHGAQGRWTSFSMAKSITSTLLGAALRDGAVAGIDDPVIRYIPELRASAYEGVRVRQLLTMTTGVRWNEDYADPAADVTLIYAAPVEPGMEATVSYMRRLDRATAPGTRWHYNTGETDLLGVVVARATGKELGRYASEKIWAAAGMEADAYWMLDRSGHEHAGCCLQTTTRDLARFGQFVLDGGRIDGRPVLADGWLEAATRTQVDTDQPQSGYGYQWWTYEGGTFSAIGIHGQQLHIDPARRLVIAIHSAWPVPGFTPESLAARIGLLRAIKAAVDAERGERSGR
jgi:CubicO group peptidase (beta-lactamase class C family)